jgi:hypothetical protein
MNMFYFFDESYSINIKETERITIIELISRHDINKIGQYLF